MPGLQRDEENLRETAIVESKRKHSFLGISTHLSCQRYLLIVQMH